MNLGTYEERLAALEYAFDSANNSTERVAVVQLAAQLAQQQEWKNDPSMSTGLTNANLAQARSQSL